METHWQSLLEHLTKEKPKLAELLTGHTVELDAPDHFLIVSDNRFFEEELRHHIVEMLSWLRARTHLPQLNCNVKVVAPEREAVAYMPHDKYEAMVSANKTLESFHVLFPEVDY